MFLKYSFVPNCRGGGGQIAHFLENNPQVHLILVREIPKNNPLHFKKS